MIKRALRHALLIVSCVGSFPALATDSKIWSGALCSPAKGSQVADFDRSLHGGIENKSMDSRFVVCPLTRDSELPFGNDTKSHLFVRGLASTGGHIVCILTKGTLSTGFFSLQKATLVGNTGHWTLSFNHGDLAFPSFSAINVSCALPPNAQLTQISLHEDGATEVP